MRVLALLLCAPLLAAGRTVLVTGATGKTGLPAYKWLKQQANVTVRALVRNATKARSKLGCYKCDEAEGIFVGDVTKKETLSSAMKNVDALLMAVGATKDAKEIIFDGTRNQLEAFALAPGNSAVKDKQVVKVSSALTTKRFNPVDLIVGGAFFYHGVSDSYIASAGVPFTIVQPCALDDSMPPAHQTKLIVSHDDLPLPDGHPIAGPHAGPVSRDDVAHIAAYASLHPAESKNVKFDLCAELNMKPEGSETQEIERVLKEALLPWDVRKSPVPKAIVV